MSGFKQFLIESSIIDDFDMESTNFEDLKVKDDPKYYDRPTPYDWFIKYYISTGYVSTGVMFAWQEWIEKGTGAHPLAFIYDWYQKAKQLDADIKAGAKSSALPREVTDRNKNALRGLIHEIKDSVSFNGSGEVMFAGDLELHNIQTALLAGVPKFAEVTGYVDISSIKRLDALPTFLPPVMSALKARNCQRLTSVAKIDTLIKSCKLIDLTGSPVRRGLVSMLKIENLAVIRLDNRLVADILMKYLEDKKLSPSARRIQCQAELVDRGYEEFAGT